MKKVSMIVVGAGTRGTGAYAPYCFRHPEELEIIGVCEKLDDRRERFKAKYNLPEEMCFKSYEEFFEKEKMADAVLICTNDKEHFKPAKLAAEKGYHIMLEKPISPSPREVYEIGKLDLNYDNVISVCHVLRYSPFFSTLKDVVDSGVLGKMISIAHNENICWWHFAHSFVRGNWGNEAKSAPSILAKCCHDMDILLYLVGADCRKISSFGGLTNFKKENMPKGATKMCLDNCPHSDSCKYNAAYLYTEGPLIDWADTFGCVPNDNEKVIEALKECKYGRCVYQCDNDVCDHQVVNIEFENDVTVAFTMSAFTKDCTRTIKIMGSDAEILGHMEKNEIIIKNFNTGNIETIKVAEVGGAHGGGDVKATKAFIRAVSDSSNNKSSAQTSVQSHLMAFAAEKSRLEEKVIIFKDYIKSFED